MNIIYVLIPIAMIFVTIGVIVFFWAVKSNQYDDLDREGVNILFDEDFQTSNTKIHKKSSPADKYKTREINKREQD